MSKIVGLLGRYSAMVGKESGTNKLVERLFAEMRANYVRANHVVQFNVSLPFNIKYRKEFRGYLPESYFEPNSAVGKFKL